MTIPETGLFQARVRWQCPDCGRRLKQATRHTCPQCGPVEPRRFEYQQWMGGARPAQRWARG